MTPLRGASLGRGDDRGGGNLRSGRTEGTRGFGQCRARGDDVVYDDQPQAAQVEAGPQRPREIRSAGGRGQAGLVGHPAPMFEYWCSSGRMGEATLRDADGFAGDLEGGVTAPAAYGGS